MSRLTVFLARFIGLFAILVAVALLVRGNTIIEATAGDGPVMLALAIVSLASGIAMIVGHNMMIVGHNIWSGGALPVAVTLAGWLIFAKGLLILFLAPEGFSRLLEQMHYGANYHLYLVPALAMGLYLTWGGFTAPMRR